MGDSLEFLGSHRREGIAALIYAAAISKKTSSYDQHTEARWAVEQADTLMNELRKWEQEHCDHTVFVMYGQPAPHFHSCPSCGLKTEVTCLRDSDVYGSYW